MRIPLLTYERSIVVGRFSESARGDRTDLVSASAVNTSRTLSACSCVPIDGGYWQCCGSDCRKVSRC